MKFLFVHQNFPGQYLQLAKHLGASGEHQVVFICQRKNQPLPGVQQVVYAPARVPTPEVHPYLRESEVGVLNAQQVARVALDLKKQGFVPDVMAGHNGWGEIWYLKEVFPETPLLGYFEFFYHLHGADVGFDPALPVNLNTATRLRTKNLGNLLALDTVDLGQCPTRWQQSLYPERYRDVLRVVHEGIDTTLVVPNPKAELPLPGSARVLTVRDEVVTFVARNLEPYRGFPSFMRSLPAILQQRPKAEIVIIGGDEISYGSRPANSLTCRQQLLQEFGDALDLSRVHFLGRVPYPTYLQVLQISSAHVYLTYPFVLSWSMLEAMAAGCLVIGSRTAPVEEVIRHGENGLLVDFFSAADIAGAVIAALEQPEEFRSIRAQARQTIVDGYDLHRICLPAQLRLLEEVRRRSSRHPQRNPLPHSRF